MRHGHCNWASLPKLLIHISHFQHFFVGDFVEFASFVGDAWIGCIDAVNISVNIAKIAFTAAAIATAEVSEPPRPKVEMRLILD